MKIAKLRLANGQHRLGVLEENSVRLLEEGTARGIITLSDLLHSGDPERLVRELSETGSPARSLGEVTLLAPIDRQEVWAAGVTYRRSQEARRRESKDAGSFYDLVYDADRPELFFKATPNRVVGPGDAVRIRRDTQWSVPEPEVALVITPQLRLAGYTIGNDMSARDIEGANPLYLPQAKVYSGCCALGPVVTLAGHLPTPEDCAVALKIERDGRAVFEGNTNVAQMKRTFDELIDWLARDNEFPGGVILLTGTGIVPPDDFSLAAGDVISISVAGIGTLVNVVEQAGAT